MLLNFKDKTFTSDGRTTPIIYARSGHPCMSLLDYDEDPRALFQLALVQEGSEEDVPSDHSSDNELEGLLRRMSARTEDMDEADEIELVSSSSEDESSHIWTPEEEQSDEETEEEQPEEQQGVFVTVQEADADTKFMSKGAYRHVRAALKTIQEGMVEEKGKKNKKVKRTNVEKTLAVASAEPRRAGPWRVLEIFTWTCMVTMAAHYKGWEAFEPITLPG